MAGFAVEHALTKHYHEGLQLCWIVVIVIIGINVRNLSVFLCLSDEERRKLRAEREGRG